MSGFSNFLEASILNYIFSGTAASPIYLGLSTADPTDTAAGIAEPAGGAYARKASYSANWEAAATPGGTIQNAATFTYEVATANWGKITHSFVSDAVTSGNMLMHGALTASKTVASADTARFGIGDIDISLD